MQGNTEEKDRKRKVASFRKKMLLKQINEPGK